MQGMKISVDELFGPDLDRAAEQAVTDFLAKRWDGYMALVRKLEEHPENQSGTDKTWVERLLNVNRLHYSQAGRPR